MKELPTLIEPQGWVCFQANPGLRCCHFLNLNGAVILCDVPHILEARWPSCSSHPLRPVTGPHFRKGLSSMPSFGRHVVGQTPQQDRNRS